MKKLLLIDPQGSYVHDLSQYFHILMVVVNSTATKEKLLNSTDFSDETQLVTINELLTLPFQPDISNHLIKQYMHVEGTFIYNSLRIYPSAPKLRYIYYNCLSFWSNFIDTYKPDIILSTTDLHGQAFDLLPLEIGKNIGIKSLYIAPVAAYTYRTASLVDYSTKRTLPVYDSRVTPDVIFSNCFTVDILAGKKQRNLVDALLFKLDLFKSYSWVEILVSLRKTLVTFLDRFIDYPIIATTGSFFRGGTIDYHTGPDVTIIRKHHTLWSAIRFKLFSSRIKRNYRKISSNSMPKCNYIYYPLHMEPEASLLHSNLNQQVYLAEMIASVLPDNWMLVVKEHPLQFKLSTQFLYYFLVNLNVMKWLEGYSLLSNNNKIILLKDTISSASVLQSASGVFSIAGSVILECIYMNKPVACSEDSFWSDLSPDVKPISCKDDLKAFVNDIIDSANIQKPCSANASQLKLENIFIVDSQGISTAINSLSNSLPTQ